MAKKQAPTKKSVPEETLKLAKRIKELRIAKGYTSHEAFANEKGLNRTQYGEYERGKNITWESLIKVIQAFDMTVKEFFSEGFE